MCADISRPSSELYFQVRTPFTATALICHRASPGRDEEVRLPVSAVLRVESEILATGGATIQVFIVYSEDWAPYIISRQTRAQNRYRGYELSMARKLLDSNCQPLSSGYGDVPEPVRLRRAIQGCIFGTAVADAIGLPFEGLKPGRIERLRGLPLKQRFFFGLGMVSDDTEHTCLVAQSLISSAGDGSGFARALAWRLRWWFLGLPAGIGLATLRACLKLWLFIPVRYSGVFSAGNGPAMRSAIIGVYAARDAAQRSALVDINTRITHRDPKALRGSAIVAELAARNALGESLSARNAMSELAPIIGDDDDLRQGLQKAVDSALQGQSARQFCNDTGMAAGVSGYIYHTLPVVVQIVLRHDADYEQAISEAIACGGDTDTVAAIIGGIVGAGQGIAGIPEPWLNDLWDWPRTRQWMALLGDELAATAWRKAKDSPPKVDIFRIWLRNLPFMIWVLVHGFRRLLPPY